MTPSPPLIDLLEVGKDWDETDHAPEVLRLFPTWEICRYLIPIAPEHLRRTLRQNPDLPQGQSADEGPARWFTLSDVMDLRRFFASTGRGRKTYLPYRPKTAPAQVIALSGSTPQAGQTTATLHLATRATLEGYRVLVIDLTASGTLTTHLSGEGKTEGNLHDLMARHFAQHLQSENRMRLARGADPLPVDEALATPLGLDTSALIRATSWHRLDLLPGGANLWDLNLDIADWSRRAPSWASWCALKDRLEEDGLLARYDLIFIDTPPVLDALALSALHLADHVIVPLRLGQAQAALHHIRQMAGHFTQLQTRLNTAARALGGVAVKLGQAQCQMLITRHDPLADIRAVDAVRASFARLILPPALPEETNLLALGGLLAVDPRQMPRDAYVTARAPLEALWAELGTQIATGWVPEDAAEKEPP